MAKAASEKTTAMKIGATIRVDGHDYAVTEITDRGVFGFARPKDMAPGSTSYRAGRGVVAEVKDSGEGWLYLPNRITPKAINLVRDAVTDGQIEPEQEAAVLAALRNHPKYADRDDYAVRDINAMYDITLWEV